MVCVPGPGGAGRRSGTAAGQDRSAVPAHVYPPDRHAARLYDAAGGFVSSAPAAAASLPLRDEPAVALRDPSGPALNGKGKIVQCKGCLDSKCKECLDNKHRRVRPGARFTRRPIRSRDQTPQKPLWAGAAARPYSLVVRNARVSLSSGVGPPAEVVWGPTLLGTGIPDTARRVIPLVHPSRGTPEPAPARRDNPPHDTDAPASGAPHDPFPGRFTKVPLAIANHYGRELGTTKTWILEVMPHLIYGYGANPVGRRQGQISYKEITDAAGVSVRTVERQLPKLIEDRFVKRLSLGQPNKSASVYELTFKALTPQPLRWAGGDLSEARGLPTKCRVTTREKKQTREKAAEAEPRLLLLPPPLLRSPTRTPRQSSSDSTGRRSSEVRSIDAWQSSTRWAHQAARLPKPWLVMGLAWRSKRLTRCSGLRNSAT